MLYTLVFYYLHTISRGPAGLCVKVIQLVKYRPAAQLGIKTFDLTVRSH